jgi:hypothetical protein
MDNVTEVHIDEWINIRNRNKDLFDKTDEQKYRYRYEACERLVLKYSE